MIQVKERLEMNSRTESQKSEKTKRESRILENHEKHDEVFCKKITLKTVTKT